MEEVTLKKRRFSCWRESGECRHTHMVYGEVGVNKGTEVESAGPVQGPAVGSGRLAPASSAPYHNFCGTT